MFEKLYIAEKPSLGKAIVEALVAMSKRPGNEKGDSVEIKRSEKGPSHIIVGGKIAVTWFYGHMLESVKPPGYNPVFAGNFRNSQHLLPVIPGTWKIIPIEKSKSQLELVQSLVNRSKVIVNAGDPDPEGMLLIQEALEYFACTKPVLRMLPNAMDITTITKAILAERDNQDFIKSYFRALGRTRADWLVGMNMSRACTCANVMGDLLSVGRVQTPTLALVVKRDLEIENFTSATYYMPTPTFLHANGEYTGTWIKPEAQPGLDSEKRLVDENVAKSIVAAIKGKSGTIAEYVVSDRSQKHPLPYSLSTIQSKANTLFGLTGAQVLEICQSLYETHKVASYPRTDTGYLKESQHAEAKSVLAAISKFDPNIARMAAGANPSIRSQAWNDAEVVAHHGIIPTAAANYSALNPNERKVFTLIVKQYIAQFYPEYTYKQTQVVTACGGHQFKSSGRTPINLGWKSLFSKEEEEAAGGGKKKEGEEDQLLPVMKREDNVNCTGVDLGKKATKAPPRYTEAALLRAMANISETVSDPALKKKLEASKGIGTPATQSNIIERLKEVGFINTNPKSKQLISSPGAREFIKGLPLELTDAALTAQWEMALDRIESGSITLEQFMTGIENWITKLTLRTLSTKIKISLDKKAPTAELTAAGAGDICPKCKVGTMMPHKSTKGQNAGGYFLGCSEYRNGCKHTQNVASPDPKSSSSGGAKSSGGKSSGPAKAASPKSAPKGRPGF